MADRELYNQVPSIQFASLEWVAHWFGAARADHYVEALRRFEERRWAGWSWSWSWFFFEWFWLAYRKATPLVLAVGVLYFFEVQVVLHLATTTELIIVHVLLMKFLLAIFAERILLWWVLHDARTQLTAGRDLLGDAFRNRYGPLTSPAHDNPELF